MDETPIKAGRSEHGKMKTAYFWPVYGEHDEVCFPWFPSREGANIYRALGADPAAGAVLLTDGYAAYASYAKKVGIIHAQCWAHYPESAVIWSVGGERRDVLCSKGMCLRIRPRCHPCRLSSVEMRDDHAFRGLHEMYDAAATVPSVSVARCQARLAR